MITITEAELEKIKAIENVTAERIMFVLLALSKQCGKNTLYVTKSKLIQYSKCHIDTDYLDRILYKLNMLQYIKTNRSGSRTINIIQEDSEPRILIADLDNMIHEYLKTCNGKTHIFCELCGAKTKVKGRNQKYCEGCSKDARRKKTRIYVQKCRENNKCKHL